MSKDFLFTEIGNENLSMACWIRFRKAGLPSKYTQNKLINKFKK